MSDITMDEATARFERVWQRAVESVEKQAPLTAAEPPADTDLDVPLPQHAIEWIRNVSASCVEQGLLDAESHERLSRGADEQAAIFETVDRTCLRDVVAGIARR